MISADFWRRQYSRCISMPIKKYYHMYKQLKQYGGNSEHYDKIVRASRDYYHRKMLEPEYREQQRIKARERYYKKKSLSISQDAEGQD